MQNMVLIFMIAILSIFSMVPAQKKVVCYYGSWATYRPDAGKFDVEDIDPNLCTHLIYTFIDTDENGTIVVLDPDLDIIGGGFRRFNDLRIINPSLKTLIAIGGWNANSTIYSKVVGDNTKRTNFVNNLYNFVKLHDFNGLDFVWEYPAQRGGGPEDKANFVLLIRELRALFAPDGLLLTAAVGVIMDYTTTSYNVPELAANLDFINLMTFDFHGSWDGVTGIHSSLHQYSADPFNPNSNVDATVQHWMQQGAPAEKLIIGIPFFGRSYTLKSSEHTSIGAPTTGGGNPGPYTQSQGMLGYNEICEIINQGGWTEVWNQEAETAFCYKNTQWISYDNSEAVRRKAIFITNRTLGGAMVWSVDTDDFRGICSLCRYPLLKVIHDTLLP